MRKLLIPLFLLPSPTLANDLLTELCVQEGILAEFIMQERHLGTPIETMVSVDPEDRWWISLLLAGYSRPLTDNPLQDISDFRDWQETRCFEREAE